MAWYRCGGTPSSVLSLPTPSEASGAIARFNTDLTENLLSAVAEFSASQASGTPTPANPIPIVGVDKVNVTRTGKNLFGGTFDTLFPLHFNTNTTITVSAKATNALRIGWYDESQNLIDYWGVNTQSGDRRYRTFELPNTAYYVRFYYVEVTEMQIELGSTATDYEPYVGNTVTVAFGQTVYGGTINLTTGVLRITKGFHTVSSSRELSRISGSVYRVNKSNFPDGLFPSSASANGVICEKFKSLFTTMASDSCYMDNNGLTIRPVNSYESANAFFEDVGEFSFVYPLATPIEIQLTAQEIEALIGTNNIWVDTGDVALKYFETVGHKI